MICETFLFDVIIVDIFTPETEFVDPGLLSVDVTFNNNTIPVSASQINIQEFPNSKAYEFVKNPEELKEQMEETPMEMIVKYDGIVIGKS